MALLSRLEAASVHGRFQPFHNGHLTYISLVFERAKHVVIGITNPDETHLVAHDADPHRHLPKSNPFSYFERLVMIRASLIDAGYSADSFTIVPFPIDNPAILTAYCPRIPVFLRHRGAWSDAKARILRIHGWHVVILEDEQDLSLSATEIRGAILARQSLDGRVPTACIRMFEEIGAYSRIVRLNVSSDSP
jgi:cytidyltransferase-like protein